MCVIDWKRTSGKPIERSRRWSNVGAGVEGVWDAIGPPVVVACVPEAAIFPVLPPFGK